GLTAFWENMREYKTPDGNKDYRIYGRAADLLRQAQKADKMLASQPDFQMMAADVFYNDACAKAVAKKPAEAVAALREAVGFGWENLEHMSQDPDLDSIHDTAGYKTFFADAVKARQDMLATRVAGQMEQTAQFEFNFEVEDVTGKSISKAGF